MSKLSDLFFLLEFDKDVIEDFNKEKKKIRLENVFFDLKWQAEYAKGARK